MINDTNLDITVTSDVFGGCDLDNVNSSYPLKIEKESHQTYRKHGKSFSNMLPSHVTSDYKIVMPISVLLGENVTEHSHLPVLPPSDKVGVLH